MMKNMFGIDVYTSLSGKMRWVEPCTQGSARAQPCADLFIRFAEKLQILALRT